MLVIADSSALIALAACGGLDLLLKLFDDVQVPTAVYDEVVIPDKPYATDLTTFLFGRSVSVDFSTIVINAGGLGLGELEAMALYKLKKADHLLIDDRRARKIAESNNIRCIGSLWVLLVAKREGHIEAIKPYVKRLQSSTLHFSAPILHRVLELANEID